MNRTIASLALVALLAGCGSGNGGCPEHMPSGQCTGSLVCNYEVPYLHPGCVYGSHETCRCNAMS